MHSTQQDSWLGRSMGERQRYRLEQRLGSGGTAEVFLATDTLLGQPVALKLLNEKLAVGEMRGRFEREVTLCAALRSDHIVRVSDHGVTPEGNPFFVMEYLQGQTLRQLLKRKRPLPIERTVNIVSQICEGLHLAHQGVTLWYPGATSSTPVQIVHRDLKPDNIFLVPTGLGELVKILDFGIAKIRSSQSASDQTRVFLGTYRYAAPEQFEIGKELDGRADLYGLGIILYEMLSGTDPFGFGPAAAQVSGGTWAVAHLNRPVLPLREQPGCSHLSPDLEALVMRCLEKEPAQRFASVQELRQMLQAATGITVGTNRFSTATAISTVDPAFPTLVPSNWPFPVAQDAATETLNTAPNLHTSSSAVPQNIHQAASQTASQAASRNVNHNLPQNLSQEISFQVPKSPEVNPLKRILFRSSAIHWAGAVCLTVAVGLGLRLLFSSSSSSSSIESVASSQAPALQPASPPVGISVQAGSPEQLLGHTDTVWTVAAAADLLASGSFDKTVRLWNGKTGGLRQVLQGHTDAVRTVAISSSGQIVASGSSDQTIKIWQLQSGDSGKLRHTLSGHRGPVWSVAISPDGQTLASGSYDGTIKLWNLQTGQLLHTLPDHYDSVWAVAISPDGNTLASGSYDGTIKLWNLQTGQLLRTLSGHTEAVRSLAISPSGDTLVSASWDKTLKIWHLPSGKLWHTLAGHTDRVVAVAIDSTGQQLVSGSLDRTLKVWQLQTGQLLETLSGHSDWVVAVAFSPDGKIISGSRDRTVRLWELPNAAIGN